MNGQIVQPSVVPGLRSSIVARPFCTQQPRHRRVSLVCSAERHDQSQPHVVLNRRHLLASALAVAAVQAAPASAYTPPPAGASLCMPQESPDSKLASTCASVQAAQTHNLCPCRQEEKCGRAGRLFFLVPGGLGCSDGEHPHMLHASDSNTLTRLARRTSAAVPPEQSDFTRTECKCPQTSGNDIFYRNPYNVEENLFVNITSPSSSSFDSVESLGMPQQAAARLRQQYLGEFMSTRLGSQKKCEIVSATSRTADGRLYYDIEVGHLSCHRLAACRARVERCQALHPTHASAFQQQKCFCQLPVSYLHKSHADAGAVVRLAQPAGVHAGRSGRLLREGVGPAAADHAGRRWQAAVRAAAADAGAQF